MKERRKGRKKVIAARIIDGFCIGRTDKSNKKNYSAKERWSRTFLTKVSKRIRLTKVEDNDKDTNGKSISYRE